MRTRSSSTKASFVAVMCCGLGKMRELGPVSSRSPGEFLGIPAYSFEVGPMRVEDVAAIAAVLRNSLRVMKFMTLMSAMVPHGRRTAIPAMSR